MTLIILSCIAAFLAGLVDSIAGGGGLIQVPALLFLFPNLPIVTLLGTNRFTSCCGTVMSSFHYFYTLKINPKTFIPILITAFLFGMLGAKVLSIVDNDILKPLIFVLLILIALYTFIKKDFGLTSKQRFSGINLQLILIPIGAILGFYDGFFGPGTGSFLMFCFISLLGFSFLEGAAFSKLTNLAANLGSVIFFIYHHHVLYQLAIPMAIFNIGGNYFGAPLAIKKGSGFVRWVFLAVVIALLSKFILSSL